MHITKTLFVLLWKTCFLLQLSAASNIGYTPQYNGKLALTENQIVWTGNNRSSHVLCSTPMNQSINSCVWSQSSFPNVITNSFYIKQDQLTVNRTGYSLYGRGFKNGECGLTIHNFNADDAGFWNCTLIQSHENMFVGSVQVRQWDKPMFKPEIDMKLKNTKTFRIPKNGGYILDISCCAKRSSPDPTLYFQIDNHTVSQNSSISFKDDTICVIWRRALLNDTMNQKVLHCIMDHISFTEDDPVQEDMYTFNVEYLTGNDDETDIVSKDSSNTGKLLVVIGFIFGAVLLVGGIIAGFVIFARRRRRRRTVVIKTRSKPAIKTRSQSAISTSNRAMGEVPTSPESDILPVNPPTPLVKNKENKDVVTNV